MAGRSLWSAVCTVALLAAALPAAFAAPAPADLIERFARLPDIWTVEVAPDGRHIAVGCEQNGRRAACVYELDAIDNPPLVLNTRPEQRLYGIRWSSPEWLLLSVSLVDDISRISNRDLVRLRRLLALNIRTREGAVLMHNAETGFTVNLTAVAAAPAATPNEILMPASYWRGQRANDTRIGSAVGGWRTALYRVDLRTGATRPAVEGSADTYWFGVDADGQVVAQADYNDRARRDTIWRAGKSGLTKLFELTGVNSGVYQLYGLAPGGKAIALGKYDEAGLYATYEIDLDSGKIRRSEMGPAGVDIAGAISDLTTGSVVGAYYVDDVWRQHFIDPALQKVATTLTKALPGKSVYLDSWSADRNVVAVSVAGAGEPDSYFLFDARQKALSPVGEMRPALSKLPMAPITRVRYTARDGLEIDSYLTLPPGKTEDDGPFPLLLFPHGGPFARDDAGFDWWAGYFAQRGYAVLKPNFRGSDGYGLEFRKKGYGEFGGAMIDDIIDGAHNLVKAGIADPARICTMGASYGGYAALMVTLHEPSLARCAIAVNAVTEPAALLGDAIKRWGSTNSEALRFWEDYMGSRFRETGEKASISPVRNAEAIKVPVLLLHGTLDATVPIDESRTLQRRMQAAGGSVRLVELPGADHQLDTAAVRSTLLKEIDAFLEAQLAPK